jgi:cytochrome c oxidase subunit 2
MVRLLPRFVVLALALAVLALVVVPALLPGRTHDPLWPIDPVSPVAARLDWLWTIVSYIAAGVVILVGGLMCYAVLRFGRPGSIADDEPPQIHGNPRLEITWTFIPILIMAVIFALAASTLRLNATSPMTARQTPGLVEVDIRGYQWGWAYRFPQVRGLSVGAGDLHLPVEHSVAVRITSSDVAHDWWGPALDAHIDAYPNHVQRSWYLLRTSGTYYAQCSKFCGLLHWQMHNNVVVEAPAAFARWALRHGARLSDLVRLLDLPDGRLAGLSRRCHDPAAGGQGPATICREGQASGAIPPLLQER